MDSEEAKEIEKALKEALVLRRSGPMNKEARLKSVPGQATLLPFFPVATHKFVVLSVCTLGLYELYWCYQLAEGNVVLDDEDVLLRAQRAQG